MKAGLLFCLVAVVAGIALGSTLGYQSYGTPENEFGPFSDDKPVSRQELLELLGTEKPTGVPKVEVVGGTEFDFGVMRRYSKAKHQFTVKNVGTAPLQLKVTGSTCKCTAGTLGEERLAPGETTTIELEWTAQTNTRTFGQSATLTTTDPNNGVVSLTVRGNVIDIVAAEPANWTVGDVAATQPIELATTLYNHGELPIEITEVQWLDEDFRKLSEISVTKREIDSTVEPQHKSAIEAYTIRATVAAGSPQGSLAKRLRVEYQTPDAETEEDRLHPPLELALTGTVVGSLSIMGGPKLVTAPTGEFQLLMGQADPGKVTQERVYLVFRGPKRDSATLKVGQIDPDDALEAELGEPTLRGEMKVLPLVVKTKADAGETMRNGMGSSKPGSITIESDDPEVAAIRLDVLFRIGQPFN